MAHGENKTNVQPTTTTTTTTTGGRIEIIREERVLTKNGVWMRLKGGRRKYWITLDDIGNTTVKEFRALIFDKERGVNAVTSAEDVKLIFMGKKLVDSDSEHDDVEKKDEQLLSDFGLVQNNQTCFFIPQHHE